VEIPWEPTIAEVKAGLPVQYVLHRAGVLLNEFGSANCPFHDDSNPSLDTFPPNRWACAPCGKGGDVLDLLRAFSPGMNFPDVMTWAARLLGELRQDGWGGAPELQKPPFDVPAGSAVVAQAYNDFGSHDTVARLIAAKGWAFPAVWLRDAWGVGDTGTEVVIPYWSADGTLRTYRTRTLESKPKSAPGRLAAPTFYGEWRSRGFDTIILCEGESDTWAVSWAVDGSLEGIDVLGVPGAGTPPFNPHFFHDANVILAFDGDDAGRQATDKWRKFLEPIVYAGRSLDLSDGRDMASYTPDEIRTLVKL